MWNILNSHYTVKFLVKILCFMTQLPLQQVDPFERGVGDTYKKKPYIHPIQL